MALLVFIATSVAENPADTAQPRLIASGPDFAIHQFKGAVEFGRMGFALRSGIVIAHTDLQSGKLTWLITTGLRSIPTRRISYSISKLVGLAQDDKRLFAVVYTSGRMFTQDDRPPASHDPRKGQYILYVFSKAEGTKIYTWSFTDPQFFPEAVPEETVETGLLRITDQGYRVFDNVFRTDESGKIMREQIDSQ